MRKNKIIIIQLIDSLMLGGAERMSVNLANTLAREGFESHLLVTRKTGGLISHVNDDVKIRCFNKKSIIDLFAFSKLVKYLVNVKPHVLHAHETSIYWAVLLKVFIPKTKLIWHDHFGKSEQLDLFPRKNINFLSIFFDYIITVNEKINLFWESRLPSLKYRISFLKNFSEFYEIRRMTTNDSFYVLNIANFRRQKDQLTLLDAFSLFSKGKPNVQLLLVGEFIEHDWVDLVKAKIKELSLGDKVKILGPLENVLPILTIASVGVLSSESEGLPVALLEYGMAGLPTISTNVGQCGDVLGDGKFGILVSPKSSEELAIGLEFFYKDRLKAFETGERFKDFIKENYGPLNFMKIYREILIKLQVN